MNGGSVAASFNLNDWLGVVSDLSVYDASSGIPGLVGETYTFGPRFSYRKWNRLHPFTLAVIGGGHANSTNGGFLGARNAFANSTAWPNAPRSPLLPPAIPTQRRYRRKGASAVCG